MSTSVTCAPGFTRVCPMMEDVCPEDAMMMCPGGMPPAAGRMMHGSSGSSGCQCVPDFLMALVHHAMPAATRLDATDRATDVIKNEKVKLGKRTCTCTFTMETKGTRCSGQAKCDKKCTGTGAVDVDPYSFTLAVKKGKGKISKCTVAAMPTVGPVEPTGSGSGSGPVEPTGSGSGPPPMGEGMPCSCRCDCPDGAEQCDCDCNCPMMSTSVTCAPGFTRVCPMMEDVCPEDTMMMCPGGMAPAAGRMMHGSSGSSGCQCVPDFLMALVHHAMPAATRLDATDRATDVIKNEKVKLGKRTCTCTFTMETKGTRCSGQAKCDKKCTGTGAVDVDPYSFTLAVKKGKGKISKCTVAAMPTVGPVEPT